MKNGNSPLSLNRLCLLVLIACSVTASAQLSLPSQWITSGTGVDVELRLDGTIIEKGSGASTLSNADLSASNRFIWMPSRSALRAGDGTSFDSVANVGVDSAAFGSGAIAIGAYDFASGFLSTAAGQASIALGYVTSATGDGSVAMGYSSSATAEQSVAIGLNNHATGIASLAIGNSSSASALNSVAIGSNATAYSFASVSVGRLATGLSELGTTADTENWVPTDPLFEVGNGSTPTGLPLVWTHSTAFVIFKNGDLVSSGTSATFQGVVTVQPGGDIPMFTGQ